MSERRRAELEVSVKAALWSPDGRLVLVQDMRPKGGINHRKKPPFSMPGGGIDEIIRPKKGNKIERPLKALRRELREEIGLVEANYEGLELVDAFPRESRGSVRLVLAYIGKLTLSELPEAPNPRKEIGLLVTQQEFDGLPDDSVAKCYQDLVRMHWPVFEEVAVVQAQ